MVFYGICLKNNYVFFDQFITTTLIAWGGSWPMEQQNRSADSSVDHQAWKWRLWMCLIYRANNMLSIVFKWRRAFYYLDLFGLTLDVKKRPSSRKWSPSILALCSGHAQAEPSHVVWICRGFVHRLPGFDGDHMRFCRFTWRAENCGEKHENFCILWACSMVYCINYYICIMVKLYDYMTIDDHRCRDVDNPPVGLLLNHCESIWHWTSSTYVCTSPICCCRKNILLVDDCESWLVVPSFFYCFHVYNIVLI